MSEKNESAVKSLGEYQRSLERFENVNDGFILPDLHLIIRIDGHRFGPLWERVPDTDYPFEQTLVDSFIHTARSLMRAGFRVVYAFFHGDEISLLLDPLENRNQRRRSKLTTWLCSTASLLFQEQFGKPLIFYSKLSELPTTNHVVDYFMWQKKVGRRNFLSRNLGIILSEAGKATAEIDATIGKLGEEERFALLESLGRPKESFDARLIHGVALWWDESGTLFECNTLPADDEAYYQFVTARVSGPSHLFEYPTSSEVLDQTLPAQAEKPRPTPPPRASQPATPADQQRKLGFRGRPALRLK